MKNEVEKQLALENLDGRTTDLIAQTGHSELYGHDLRTLSSTTKGKAIKEVLLKKFLVANNWELSDAEDQLKRTLEWRKKFKPLSAAFEESHNSEFEKLGVITRVEYKGETKIATWNLYGAIEDRATLFKDLDGFLRWRVGLMEKGIALLDFGDERKSQMIQTHDYYNVSFLRLDSATRAASKQVVELFSSYYPEFVSQKFFVNVPKIMSWMFALAQTLMSAETAKKLSMLNHGQELAARIGDWVPEQYGGKKGVSLESLAVADSDIPSPEVAQENKATKESKEDRESEEAKAEEGKVTEGVVTEKAALSTDVSS